MISPHHLAYFNELAGGPAQGHRFLSDSNLDWGQDLRGLKAYMDREELPVVYLSYFGTAPPASYGIRYQFLPSFVENLQQPDLEERLPAKGGPEMLAISVVNLQGIYLSEDQEAYRWLKDRRPATTIGYSIYIYDLTGDVEAHWQLARIYAKRNLPSLARWELNKVLNLDPSHRQATEELRRLDNPKSSSARL
jgi:hypothetical protein